MVYNSDWYGSVPRAVPGVTVGHEMVAYGHKKKLTKVSLGVLGRGIEPLLQD